MILFHGGTEKIEKPVILKPQSGWDFGRGFYCTDIRTQAERWAIRQSRIRNQPAVLNMYDFNADSLKSLNCKIFVDYAAEWLELVVNCRKNPDYTHGFDIVYGKIANDDVGETVQAVANGLMPIDFALQKLVFMEANSQYCFCTEKSLAFLQFTGSLRLA